MRLFGGEGGSLPFDSITGGEPSNDYQWLRVAQMVIRACDTGADFEGGGSLDDD